MPAASLLVHPGCSGLIDQDRFIGDDPVGHVCYNDASEWFWSGGLGWHVCVSCAASLHAGEGRVTLPAWKALVPETPSES